MTQCYNCGALTAPVAAPEFNCQLCGALIDAETAALTTLILDIEASQLAVRAKLSYLHSKAMKSRCPMLGSKTAVVAAQMREIGDDVSQLRERLREDLERKHTKLKAV